MEMAKCIVYSYLNDDKKELLQDHINTALSLINTDSILIKYAKTIDPNYEEKLSLAIIFHDIGKAFYQKQARYGKISFIGHELFSAYIFEKYRKSAELGTEYLTITGAILLHHHPMNIIRRTIKINPRKIDIKQGITLLQCLRDELPKTIDPNAYETAIQGLQDLSSETKAITVLKATLDIILKNIKRKIIESQKFAKLFQLLTVSLITLDYISAMKTREENNKKTIFAQTIEQFYKLYFKRT